MWGPGLPRPVLSARSSVPVRGVAGVPGAQCPAASCRGQLFLTPEQSVHTSV